MTAEGQGGVNFGTPPLGRCHLPTVIARRATCPGLDRRGSVEAPAEREMEIDAVSELGIAQLDDVRLGGELRSLEDEHRQHVARAGRVSHLRDPYALGAVVETLCFVPEPLRQQLLVRQRDLHLPERLQGDRAVAGDRLLLVGRRDPDPGDEGSALVDGHLHADHRVQQRGVELHRQKAFSGFLQWR